MAWDELDPLPLKRPLPLHRLHPPDPLHPGDQVDDDHHRVHPGNPYEQNLLIIRREVHPGIHHEAESRVDGRRHRDPDEGEPDRSEDHREHGEGRVVPHEEGGLEPPVRRNAAAEHRQVQGAQREHPPPGHGPLRGEPVVQVSVGGEQQRCKGDVRRIHHLVDVERVQPGERGNRQDEPAPPRHRPWPRGAVRPARAGRSSAGRLETRWLLCSLDSGLVSIRLDSVRLRLE